MIQNNWNTSFRIMFDLHFATHRYFVEPVSGKTHVKNILMSRFMGFLVQIEKSPKSLPRHLLRTIRCDSRSTTGSNLRGLLLETDRNHVDDLSVIDVRNMVYAPVKEEDIWKIELVKELVDVQADLVDVEDFRNDDLKKMLIDLCTN